MKLRSTLCAVVLSALAATPALARDIKIWRQGPTVASSDGQIISNRNIRVTSGTGIGVYDKSGVRIQNCLIEFDQGTTGIAFRNAPGLVIVNCEFRLRNAPARGALTKRSPAISGSKSRDVEIRSVNFRDCGSGVKLLECDDATLSKIHGVNFRGPLPDGQLIQFNRCAGGTLVDFSCVNDRDISYPEDNINCYRSGGQTFERGLIMGNNAPSGVGLLWEEQDEPDARGGFGGTVIDVDFIDMGNGAVSGADGSENILFRRVRVADNRTFGVGGREDPRSGGLVFSGFGTSGNTGKNLRVEGAVLSNIADRNNLFFPNDPETFPDPEVTFAGFSRRGMINNNFRWLKQN